jgi:hypothetical protein
MMFSATGCIRTLIAIVVTKLLWVHGCCLHYIFVKESSYVDLRS